MLIFECLFSNTNFSVFFFLLPLFLFSFMSHSQNIRKDGEALTAEKRSGRGIQSFLVQLELGVDPVSGLEQVTVFGVDPDRRVHLFHLLFSVRVGLYSTLRCMFA